MTLAKLGAVVVLALLAGVGEEKVAASRVTFSGQGSLADAVTALRHSGNVITDPLANGAAFTLSAGERDFWPALDELCRQARLQFSLRNGRVELQRAEGRPGPRFVAYDGPFRGVITRRTVTAYEDPGLGLDRLTLQVDLACEPRMHPLVFKLPGNGLSWQWGGTSQSSSARAGLAAYGFEGESTRSFELRLPRPERGVKELDQLTIQGQVWVSARRLEFETALRAEAAATKEGTTFRVQRFDVNPGSRTWEVVATLEYPAESMEWESHQAGLVGNVTMTLHQNDRVVTSIGREVRTDESRRLEMHWLFRDVPGRPEAWRAKVIAPSAPVSYPLKLEFRTVELP